MDCPVCYDVTRLLTRVLNATPNGIDRIDITLARHILFSGTGPRFGATSTGFGSRLMSRDAARDAVAGIARHWGEEKTQVGDGGMGSVYEAVAAKIRGLPAGHAGRTPRRRSTIPADIAGGLLWAGRHGLPLVRRPGADLPKGCVYLNVSQFPLWVADSFTWLEARRDVRAVFFVHDLLPVSMPEYFRRGEYERHRKRLANVARFASAVLVATPAVADELSAYLAGLGRRDLPVFTAPTPVAPLFRTPREIDPNLDGHPFFVFCGTLEPRKNHLMILAAWRELVRRHGAAASKLVLVGTRGWDYEPIVDLIERSPPLRDHVIAAAGLSSPGLKRLMDNARAVLMPSFAEGYGLPVHEALAAGAPVIASDIPVFRGIADPNLTLLSPLDGEAWLDAVYRATIAGRPAGDSPRGQGPENWRDYFGRLDAFLTSL